MLNKLDLTKKFELVVQQEIKNYNDSLNLVLGSIREIKEQVRKNEIQSQEKFEMLNAKQRELVAELKLLRESLIEVDRRSESHHNDYTFSNKRNSSAIFSIVDSVNKLYEEQKKQSEQFKKFNEEAKEIPSYLQKMRINIENSMELSKIKIKKELEKTKEEIKEKPSDLIKLRCDLEEKIYRHTIDVEGIMREINVFKRECLISEKKIEHLYILLDRLKKGEKS